MCCWPPSPPPSPHWCPCVLQGMCSWSTARSCAWFPVIVLGRHRSSDRTGRGSSIVSLLLVPSRPPFLSLLLHLKRWKIKYYCTSYILQYSIFVYLYINFSYVPFRVQLYIFIESNVFVISIKRFIWFQNILITNPLLALVRWWLEVEVQCIGVWRQCKGCRRVTVSAGVTLMRWWGEQGAGGATHQHSSGGW